MTVVGEDYRANDQYWRARVFEGSCSCDDTNANSITASVPGAISLSFNLAEVETTAKDTEWLIRHKFAKNRKRTYVVIVVDLAVVNFLTYLRPHISLRTRAFHESGLINVDLRHWRDSTTWDRTIFRTIVGRAV